MISISTQNPQSQYVIRNKSISGFSFAVLITTGSGAPSAAPIDPDKFQLKATLNRKGFEGVELFNTTLRNLVLLGYLENVVFDMLGSYAILTTGSKYLVPLKISLGGPLNLKADDELTVEWQLGDGFFVAASDVVAATSSIQLDEIETTETEYFIPLTKVKVIEQGQSNPTYGLGDNVLRIVFRQDDKTTTLTADAVINNISLQTKQGLTKNDNYNEILVKNFALYPTVAEFAARKQNFVLYTGEDELDGVQLALNLNSTNVNSSKNWILWNTFITSDELVTRGAMIDEKKSIESDKKGSFNPNYIGRTQL